jgi:P-type E1-E2 ATPase
MKPGIRVCIPGGPTLSLQHLVLDVNGTLALDGRLEAGVAERLGELQKLLEMHLLTADTHGRQREIDKLLGLRGTCLIPGHEREQKEACVRALRGGVVAMGNGRNDVLMLRAADLGIAVLGGEGLCTEALLAAQVLARSPAEALDLLRFPARLVATLRC